jgi:hypothetical protein
MTRFDSMKGMYEAENDLYLPEMWQPVTQMAW